MFPGNWRAAERALAGALGGDPNYYGSLPLEDALTDFGTMGDQETPSLGSFKRQSVSKTAILLVASLPTAIFMGMSYLMSFSVRFFHPVFFGVLLAFAFCIPFLFAGRGVWVSWKRSRGESSSDPFYIYGMAVLSLVALVVAIVIGDVNFQNNMSPYYEWQYMATLSDVDPRDPGRQYMDASSIIFRAGSRVDELKSLSFKNGDTYCVAPVTFGNETQGAYDFWAVGTNCCDPFGGQFSCGINVFDLSSTAGIRLMDEGSRTFYRLAVQQAEAEYNIRSAHPIFFTYTSNPTRTISAHRHTAIEMYWLSSVVYALLMTVVVAFITSWKMPDNF